MRKSQLKKLVQTQPDVDALDEALDEEEEKDGQRRSVASALDGGDEKRKTKIELRRLKRREGSRARLLRRERRRSKELTEE
jgi:hypothetical protein